MAASIVRCSFCTGPNIFVKQTVRHASRATYYVLLPEVPPDTPETNPVMRVHDHPKFSEITPNTLITGCAKLSLDHDVTLAKHIETIAGAGKEKDFESVFEPIEKLSVPLNYAWRVAKNLSYTNGADGYRASFQRIHPQVERSRNERWVSKELYDAAKEIRHDCTDLTEFQKQLVDMYLLEARLNGIDQLGEDKKKFIQNLQNLVDAKSRYRNRVMLSHNLFSQTIVDFGMVEEFPKSVLSELAIDKMTPSRGPWKVTLNHNSYQPFLEYCGNRMERWNIWNAFQNRASMVHDHQNLSNHDIIKQIRTCRKNIAQLLGYENYAQMSMETKMAGSVENVMNMIESLKTKFESLAANEVADLQEFAGSSGFDIALDLWDIPYWRRRHREHLFGNINEGVSEYFPFPKVLNGLFSLCQEMFGIVIKESTSEVDRWHESVRFFRIIDQAGGDCIASFYVDPYARPQQKLQGSWMEVGREHSSVVGTEPISFLNLNLAPPSHYSNTPSLMTIEEVGSLFYEFGHGLQQMLTVVPYSEIAGQRNVEWDALQVCATTMSMILHTPKILQSVSGHFETGDPLPDKLVEKALQARKHMVGFDTMRQLYVSAFDMEMYVSDDPWRMAMSKIWDEFMPLPLADDDNHPCSMTAIFSDQYPAAYYSFKWAEMIAADVFGAFQEEGGLDDQDKLAVVGKRFRDTLLSHGGGVPAGEVFRRFRGRDPSQDALLKYYGVA